MGMEQVIKQLNEVYLGKEDVVRLCCTALLAEGHILLEDVPGTGKTLLAKTIAASFDGVFSRIQFTADLLPSDVIGADYFNMQTQTFDHRQGPIFANIVLIDEINRAVPRTQSALLEAMEERQVSIGGETYPMPKPFFVIATQNPIESAGTFPLPDAQLDRFLISIPVGYPDVAEERELLLQVMRQTRKTVEAVATLNELRRAQEEVKQVSIQDDVLDYLLGLVHATREHASVEVGVSPRGAIALMRASQSYAYLNDRLYVIPEDVKAVAPYVLSHRLTLTLEGGIKSTKQDIIRYILDTVSVPVEG
ncbi:MAG: MoxR family ATPase [Exiguobacterium sp.]|uniref:AAA family ATPase n=1 Tax=unclassified Exiguobacterium TaxID=2644629 RepID=UPI0009913D47|nr:MULTISPECIES: MoxR family ATPase [unclassified Exiguobacterium]MBQ6458046.1 MoxR family ATPase [Exiguobacterium sp.]MBR2077353.1 MoxR family ATPase [Exiguobacterium sp.]MBR2681616.1 MoxR family ATPase [Exiguobacterium sp.]MBR3217238.1 MoxR family ATPase [Exiguobacterium sp.]MCM3281395.1 MoxR family ATPase [Exiguobacterium sp. MER 193]